MSEASTSKCSVASASLPCVCHVSAWILIAFRRFERELEKLRKELAELNARSERSSPTLGPQSDDDMATLAGSPKALSPLVTAQQVSDANIPHHALNGNTSPVAPPATSG